MWLSGGAAALGEAPGTASVLSTEAQGLQGEGGGEWGKAGEGVPGAAPPPRELGAAAATYLGSFAADLPCQAPGPLGARVSL